MDNELAIRKIYDAYYGVMMKIAIGILKDYALAEDAVSISLVKINRNLDFLDKLTGYQKRGYIVNIVKNTSRDILRKRGKDSVIKDVTDDFFDTLHGCEDDILDDLIMKEGCASIKKAIKSLPDKLREVVYLFAVYQQSHEEISQKLGITGNASKMRLHRAKQKIKKLLAGENDGK
ncbi:MAG: sigma-70 family RNA polymerase sigma factor [Defluviitaleaceae bacterium]|nr:sigma-70 family RNA polymerase sigma factor [Defluviitaleaceae bacterium]MCL2264134.1 sigma-70 family RNA polymerase sigma factor [Defluviitaleaceae bacterium]